jgi:predicted ester cyclase
MQQILETLFETFPDFHYRIVEMTAEDDRVVCKMSHERHAPRRAERARTRLSAAC